MRTQLTTRLALLAQALGLALAVAACAEASAPAERARHPLGKEDSGAASCVGFCGGPSDSACWCDEACVGNGDCCADAEPVCRGITEPIAKTPEELCAATGGAWMFDACDCRREDPEAGAFVWDAADGCVAGEASPADPAALCAATGGVWQAGACDCSVDAQGAWVEFDAEVGCALLDSSELLDAALGGGTKALLDRFPPASGGPVWLVDRPGAVDYVTRHDTLAAALADLSALGWTDAIADVGACDAGLHEGAFPEVDCEADHGIAEAGCHLASLAGQVPSFTLVMEITNASGLTDYSPSLMAEARAADQGVRAAFVDSRLGVTLGFARVAGAWHLVFIDLSRFSCGA